MRPEMEAPKDRPVATSGDQDASDQVSLAEGYDTGSTYEGGGMAGSIDRPITLDEIVDSSDLAVRATVGRIYESALNTRSGDLELTAEQRRSSDPTDFPGFEPRTMISLDVIEVLGLRRTSRISPSNQITLDVKGGSVRLTLPIELAEHLRYYDPLASDTSALDDQQPPPDEGLVDVSISQSTNLYWTEGDEVIVFLTMYDVVLATGSGEPEYRSAIAITYDPAGAFTLKGDVAEANRTDTEIGQIPVADLAQIASTLDTATRPAAPMD